MTRNYERGVIARKAYDLDNLWVGKGDISAKGQLALPHDAPYPVFSHMPLLRCGVEGLSSPAAILRGEVYGVRVRRVKNVFWSVDDTCG